MLLERYETLISQQRPTWWDLQSRFKPRSTLTSTEATNTVQDEATVDDTFHTTNGRHDLQTAFRPHPVVWGCPFDPKGFLSHFYPLFLLYRPEAGSVKCSSTTQTSLEMLSTV